jgi:hypothetical protein
MKARKLRGRPKGTLGPIAVSILSALEGSAMTASALARKLKLRACAARYTCSRLEDAGLLIVVDRIKVTGSHKPVACYGRAQPHQASQRFQLPMQFFAKRS